MVAKLDLGGMRVLIVDDEPDILTTLSALLECFNADVTTEESGMKAFDLIAARKFDLLILDIQMPHVDGWKLIKAIRAHPDPVVSDLPVLALTARVGLEGKDRVLQAGFTHYFRKPIERQKFLECLKTYSPKA